MTRQALQKIWKDPVWSKIISVGIIALLTILFNAIIATKQSTSFITAFNNFWTYKIDLWIVTLLLIIIIAFTIYIVKKNFKYDNETLDLDRKLFNQIRNESNMEDLILEIKTNGFSSRPVKMERIETLIEILENSKKPNFEFINPKLNKLKKNIIKEFENLNAIFNSYIFGTNNSGWVSIPYEWEYNQPERMQEAQQTIEMQENIFTKSYQTFITEGRKILRV